MFLLKKTLFSNSAYNFVESHDYNECQAQHLTSVLLWSRFTGMSLNFLDLQSFDGQAPGPSGTIERKCAPGATARVDATTVRTL